MKLESKHDITFISNTLYVPGLKQNLISISKITDKNLKVIFIKNIALIKNFGENSVEG